MLKTDNEMEVLKTEKDEIEKNSSPSG